MLTTRLTTPNPTSPTPEDILSAALPALYQDDEITSHGTPGGTIIYTSPAFGPLTLQIPDIDEGYLFFAHYLWNSAVIAADLLERAHQQTNATAGDGNGDDDNPFRVAGESTLEVGAGTALPSLLCALCGAARVVITDHVDSAAITTDTIARNVSQNLFSPAANHAARARTAAAVSVRGYVWGETSFHPAQAAAAAAAAAPLTQTGTETETERFSRVLVCDCLWKPAQHGPLIASLAMWLDAAPGSRALVIAGFHTGRSIVAAFFELAAGEDTDGRGGRGPLALVDIYEVDVDGTRRDWARERVGETIDQTKRWCVVGILKRR